MSAPQPPIPQPPVPGGHAAPGAPTAPYLPPQDARCAAALQAPRRAASPLLGRIALVLAIGATVGASILLAVALAAIGAGIGPRLQALSPSAGLEILSPVREWVLLAEVAAWGGTALGVWALVQGIVAVVRDRGRRSGIAAIATAALGPVVAAGAAFGGAVAGIAGSGGV
ncbi:hypothetical protein B5M43_002330 [Microbacterium sp. MEC084]|uniref:hypothetical protein n=1 Tax=unclassified Microbacterium TaxID=2609290 RepID=UPI0006F78D79|nr:MULTISPECIES: hypothetical protein [unclassified Microbacterium]KQZ05044.1 hypothetical protein ASD19_03325 [Microbacterium sp. Root53]MCD1267689.1 hypothetical protein [Microbacterium sp. MEC084]